MWCKKISYSYPKKIQFPSLSIPLTVSLSDFSTFVWFLYAFEDRFAC